MTSHPMITVLTSTSAHWFNALSDVLTLVFIPLVQSPGQPDFSSRQREVLVELKKLTSYCDTCYCSLPSIMMDVPNALT